jgi:hypothetical protein
MVPVTIVITIAILIAATATIRTVAISIIVVPSVGPGLTTLHHFADRVEASLLLVGLHCDYVSTEAKGMSENAQGTYAPAIAAMVSIMVLATILLVVSVIVSVMASIAITETIKAEPMASGTVVIASNNVTDFVGWEREDGSTVIKVLVTVDYFV